MSGGPTVWWRGCPASVCERHQDASEPRGCVVPFKGAAGVMLSQHQALIYGSASTPPHTHTHAHSGVYGCLHPFPRNDIKVCQARPVPGEFS